MERFMTIYGIAVAGELILPTNLTAADVAGMSRYVSAFVILKPVLFFAAADQAVTAILSASTNGFVFNSLQGAFLAPFFQRLYNRTRALSPETPSLYPVMSFRLSELDVQTIGAPYVAGHFAAAAWFQSAATTGNSPAAAAFVSAYRARYGATALVTYEMQNAFVATELWLRAVRQARSFADAAVRQAMFGLAFAAPEGNIAIAASQYASKALRIGRVRASDGQFDLLLQSLPKPPQPWNQLLMQTQGYGCDWQDTSGTRGEKYQFPAVSTTMQFGA